MSNIFKRQIKDFKSGKTITFDFGGFKPFWYQRSIVRAMLALEFLRYVFLILPRRAGKTVLMVVYLILMAIMKAEKGTDLGILKYGIVYPELQNGKDACWDDIEARTVGLPSRKINKQRGFVEFELPTRGTKKFLNKEGELEENWRMVKVRLQIVGLKNMDSRRGGGFDGLCIDEIGFVPFGHNKVIRPMVSDKVRQPTFLIKVGTPNEENDFWGDFDKYREKEESGDPRYFTFWSDYKLLQHIDEDTFEEMTLDMSPEEIDIELHCKRGVQTGAKFYITDLSKVQKDGRVREIAYDHSQSKVLSCDIGSSKRDLFACWVSQWNQSSGMHEMVDYTEIADADDGKIHQWCQERGHKVGQIILPWDGATGMKSAESLFRERFPNAFVECLSRGEKIERIRATRVFFNRVAFDLQSCALGLRHLKGYSKKWDKVKRIYLVDPKHDVHSHAADAFGHLALADKQQRVVYSKDFDIYSGSNQNKRVQKSYEPMEDYWNPSSTHKFENEFRRV